MTVARHASTTSMESDEGAGRTLIRWSAVFAGTLLGLATLALLTSLWLALANASNVGVIQRNLEWFIGVSAVACLFLAGLLAGYLSGVRGAGTGFLHGSTIWALLMIVSLSVGIPAILNVFSLGQLSQDVQTTTTGVTSQSVYNALWGTFWTILGGFIAAGIGGAIGGAVTRDADHIVRVDGETTVPSRTVDDTVPSRTVDDDDARYTRT
jgi:hypothetical protein